MATRTTRRAPPRHPPAQDRFDAAYYARYYGDPRTAVSDLAAVERLAGFVAAYLRYLDLEVGSILDLGCGVGHWRTAAASLWPTASYHGVEWSEHLCAQHGWTRGSVADFDPAQLPGRAPRTFDLVVCQGVLQYLDDRAAAAALRNLGRLCGGALYLEALTARDWRQNVDRRRTDGAVHRRPGSFYRDGLRRRFHDCGGGVFVARRSGVALFELEAH